jgi:hypothetical protein
MRHPMEGRMSVWCKAPPGAQGALIHTNPTALLRAAIRRPPWLGGRMARWRSRLGSHR